MDITNELIDKLADLAKLEFEGAEKENIKSDMAKVVNFVDKLNELDTTGIEPLIFMAEGENILRDDEVISSITHEEALLNAPKKDSDYFRVPKFLDK
ncbi:MAG: Asp-tRNA(Asn)/Glu-tRNA(Gln) amidotransferase subunit GatC [Bacteroidia bacterium]|jgi:aspartyl-tRNA(Asn)/glutamyl-tRNA(Gln) amidotransferase subunit C